MKNEHDANLALAAVIRQANLALRARQIAASLGTYTAAGYLRNRGVGLLEAVNILARRR